MNQTWYPGETVIAGIGQGDWVVTPIQLVTALATIASRGERRQPHLLRAVQAGINTAPQPAPAPLPRGSIIHNPSTWPTIEQGMVGVVNAPNGTAHGLGDGFPYVIAGKTGTAERYSRTDETWTIDRDLIGRAPSGAVRMLHAGRQRARRGRGRARSRPQRCQRCRADRAQDSRWLA